MRVSTSKVITLAGNYSSESEAEYENGVAGELHFNFLHSIVISSNSKKAYITDRNNNKIRVMDLATNTVTTITASSRRCEALVGRASRRVRPFSFSRKDVC